MSSSLVMSTLHIRSMGYELELAPDTISLPYRYKLDIKKSRSHGTTVTRSHRHLTLPQAA